MQHGITAGLDASFNVINSMINKSLEDNIADFTEFGVDNLITMRVTESLVNLTKFTGGVMIEAGREMLEITPTNLRDSTVAYMKTSAGEMVAVAEKTGEDLNVVASKQIAANKTTNTTGGKGGNKGKPTVEAVKGSEAWKKLHPNGKFKPSAKHHANSSGNISKPPRDGQTALDNSFEVKRSMERVAVQDDKVIILKQTSKDVYHGYIHEDLNTLDIEVKKTLVNNGFMKDPTAKKLIKHN